MRNGKKEKVSGLAQAAEAVDTRLTEIEELVETLRDKAFEALQEKKQTSGGLRVVHIYRESLRQLTDARGKYVAAIQELELIDIIMDVIEDTDEETYNRIVDEIQRAVEENEALSALI